MSNLTGFAEDVEYPLRLLAHGVPAWLVAEKFGHDAHYWDRQVERLGRNSLVGTTVRDPQRLPQQLTAAEHHTRWCGEKAYITRRRTTVVRYARLATSPGPPGTVRIKGR